MWGQKSLPYSYNFDDTDLDNEGWTTSNLYDGGSSYNVSQRYNNNTYSKSGSYSFRFYGASNKVQYLISPEIESTTDGVVFSFYLYVSASTTQIRTFSVGYSTTDNDVNSFSNFTDYSFTYPSSEWRVCSTNIPSTAKYVAIKYTSSLTSYIDDISFVKDTPYKIPTNFSLNSFTENSATFSWTPGYSEKAWQLAYSTDADFTPGTPGLTLDITSNPYTLSGLTTSITYYASIRANYGDGNYSEWTEKIAFTPNDEIEMLLYDGTTQSYNIPISSSNVSNPNALTKTQFIIPSSDLRDIQNRQIKKLTFYASRNSVTWGAATFEVYMKETNNISFNTTAKEFESWGTCVYNNQGLSTNNSNGQLEIILNTPFNYSTGNLMIGFKQLTKGTSPSTTYWYSTQQHSNNAIYSYGTYVGVSSYSPKVALLTVAAATAPVKVDDNGYTTFASTYPLDLTVANLPSGLKAYKAAVNGDKVNFTEINQTVPANTGVLLAGTPDETYFIPVAESGIVPEDNEFEVNSTGGTFAAESGYTYYGMLKNSDPLTFGVFDPVSVAIPANKAYLKVADAGEARVLTCSFFDETTTGIIETRTEGIDRLTTTKVYNLSGQQVANPTKGFYIINGKKHIIK